MQNPVRLGRVQEYNLRLQVYHLVVMELVCLRAIALHKQRLHLVRADEKNAIVSVNRDVSGTAFTGRT